MTTIYKTLNGTRGAYGHGDYSKYMPHGKRPGKWLPKVTPVLCKSGYHGCRDLGEVLAHFGSELYEVEVRGACVEGDDKAAWEQMRLVRRVAEWNLTTRYLFNIDCARHVQDLWHSDDRLMLTAALDIFTAEAEYGNEWEDAAEKAAWDAWTVRDARDGWDGAMWAARVARAARGDLAARDAEKAWQLDTLARYLAGEVGPFVEEES